MINKQFALCANTIPVLGVQRSIICDLMRGSYSLIPNAIYHILTDKEIKTVNQALIKYGKDDKNNLSIINEYFEFLIEKEFIFFTENPNFYPSLDLAWDYPAIITNSIIDIKKAESEKLIHLLNQLEELRCTTIQLRFFDFYDLEFIAMIFVSIKQSIIETIEVLIPYSENIIIENWVDYVKKQPRIGFIQFYNAPLFETILEGKNGRGYIFLVEDSFINEKQCGVVSPFYFVSNIYSFTEAQKHNTCLNRKNQHRY